MTIDIKDDFFTLTTPRSEYRSWFDDLIEGRIQLPSGAEIVWGDGFSFTTTAMHKDDAVGKLYRNYNSEI